MKIERGGDSLTHDRDTIKYSTFISGGRLAPGRFVAVPPSVPVWHPAGSVLPEFGGLEVGQSGTGEQCASSDVAFQLVRSDNSTIQFWSKLLRTELVGVASIQNAHAELYVDDIGRFFVANCIDDGFCFVGKSFQDAMESLLLGRRCRPLLRPDQHQLTMYEDVFAADDPRIYKYA